MKPLYIFLLGLAILVGAIILNILAHRAGVLTWYDFVADPGKANLASYLWLFILYPLALGTIAYFVARLLNL